MNFLIGGHLTNPHVKVRRVNSKFTILGEVKNPSISRPTITTRHVSIRYKNDIWQTYNHFVEVFYDYLKLNNDLRDLDFKKNLEVKVDLCKQAENLINEKSLNKMHQELQLLHEKWKNIGPVNKDERESIWERFQEASKKINKKRNDF